MTAVVPPAEPRASTDQKTRDLTREEPDERPMGLARISQSGTPPHNDIKTIAILLLRMCGLILVLILVMATWVAWFQPGSLKDVIGFFATVVATLGTLLDGVVAFLLQPALTRVTPGRAGPAVPGRG